VPTFIKWAEKADEPLRSYASGLLGASMHMSDVAGTYRYRVIIVIKFFLLTVLDFSEMKILD
jgi:hypothetical protein